jgi:hypothetical protein
LLPARFTHRADPERIEGLLDERLTGILKPRSRNCPDGVVLGAKSQHLADLDLDFGEAIALADLHLPVTDAVFGWRSKLRLHRLFIAPGAVYEKFTDPMTGDTLLEIGADGREDRDGDKRGAHQTLFPPSITDGERREW